MLAMDYVRIIDICTCCFSIRIFKADISIVTKILKVPQIDPNSGHIF